MAVTEASFKATFPEFAATDTARVTRCIALAEAAVSEAVFGARYDLAVSYLAAHHLNADPQSLDTPAYPGYTADGGVTQAAVLKGTRKTPAASSSYLDGYRQLLGAVVGGGIVA